MDVVEVLTEGNDPSGYIKTMKRRDQMHAKGWGQIVTPLSVPPNNVFFLAYVTFIEKTQA